DPLARITEIRLGPLISVVRFSERTDTGTDYIPPQSKSRANFFTLIMFKFCSLQGRVFLADTQHKAIHLPKICSCLALSAFKILWRGDLAPSAATPHPACGHPLPMGEGVIDYSLLSPRPIGGEDEGLISLHG